MVPVGSAVGAGDGLELVERQRADGVVLDPQLLDGDGLGLCRRIRALEHPPRVVLYSSDREPSLSVLVRVAGADGLVDKSASPSELFDAIGVVARGGVSLPPIGQSDLDAAAGKVDDDDLALLAMLMDRTSPVEVADALHLDRRKLGRRIERLMGRLRGRPPRPRTV